MIQRGKEKLRSQSGASITFALLLFLVCAVLSSVILAAATAAAGRMSKIAETDQRYYAVTSAAEMVKDLMETKVVSHVHKDVTGSEAYYYLVTKPADEIIIPTDLGTGQSAQYTETEIVSAGIGFPAVSKSSGASTASSSVTIVPQNATLAKTLTVSVEAFADDNGNVTIKLSDTIGKDTDGHFSIYLNYEVDKQTAEREHTVDTVTYSGGNRIVTQETTPYDIDTYTWHLASMKTVAGE